MPIRSVNLQTDLLHIATLLEMCFEDMDGSGRAAVQEMRTISQTGPLLWILGWMDRMLNGIMQGFVWTEDDRIIGNVSLYPAGFDHLWVIANVAVHPEYRRRGIAYELCAKALERIRERKGHAALLQVDASNPTAQRVYERLGFFEEGIFTRWRRRDIERAPVPSTPIPQLTYRARRDIKPSFYLAQQLRPNERGGLGWLRPTSLSMLQPGLTKTFTRLLSAGLEQQWVVRSEIPDQLDALIITETQFGAINTRFDLLVHPSKQGILEAPLVNFIIRQASNQMRGVITEHPANDEIAAQVFREYRFTPERTQIHMRCPLF